MSDTELSLPAGQLFFRIWEKLNFPVGLPDSEWPHIENFSDAKQTEFLSREKNRDTVRLTSEAVNIYPKSQRDTALKELCDREMLFSIQGGYLPTYKARGYLVQFWCKYTQDPRKFQELMGIKTLEEAEKAISLWEYRAAISQFATTTIDLNHRNSRLECARVSSELVQQRYSSAERAREKLHERMLGLLYAILGGMIGAIFMLIINNR